MTNLNNFGKSVFQSSTEVYKKPIVIQIGDALTEETTIDTLEGPVVAPVGYRVVTGVKGEQYPIPATAFAQYEAVEGGYAKMKVVVRAIQLSQAGQVTTPWGATLNAQIGDFLVMEDEDNMWVVEKDIFENTYVVA